MRSSAPRGAELVGQEIDGLLFSQVVAAGLVSTVYRATQRSANNRTVAVKVLDAAEQRLLLPGRDDLNPLSGEVRFSEMVRSPSVVRVFSTGRLPDGRYYLAMEFVEGSTLEEEIGERGSFPEATALALLSQAAGAVGCLHQKGIVHRDVKPGNLILPSTRDATVQVKLIDLGQAKLAHDRDDWESRGDQVVDGTPRYMAPEQARGDGTSLASDVYALGAMGYELMTGKPALTLKRDDAEACIAYLRSDRPLPALPLADLCPSVYPGTTALIGRCLSREISERPQDADALKEEVEALIQQLPDRSGGPLWRALRGLWVGKG